MKLHSGKSFVVIREIGSLARVPDDGDRLWVGCGKSIPILPGGSLKRPFEWVIGYTAVDGTGMLL